MIKTFTFLILLIGIGAGLIWLNDIESSDTGKQILTFKKPRHDDSIGGPSKDSLNSEKNNSDLPLKGSVDKTIQELKAQIDVLDRELAKFGFPELSSPLDPQSETFVVIKDLLIKREQFRTKIHEIRLEKVKQLIDEANS